MTKHQGVTKRGVTQFAVMKYSIRVEIMEVFHEFHINGDSPSPREFGDGCQSFYKIGSSDTCCKRGAQDNIFEWPGKEEGDRRREYVVEWKSVLERVNGFRSDLSSVFNDCGTVFGIENLLLVFKNFDEFSLYRCPRCVYSEIIFTRGLVITYPYL